MYSQATTLQASYSAVPALIIVCKDGGITRITPIPLNWALIWGLLGHWFSGLTFPWAAWPPSAWNRLRSEIACPPDFQTWLIALFYKVILGRMFAGISWSRSLAWGVLGI
jgi:hypothetical protein